MLGRDEMDREAVGREGSRLFEFGLNPVGLKVNFVVYGVKLRKNNGVEQDGTGD